MVLVVILQVQVFTAEQPPSLGVHPHTAVALADYEDALQVADGNHAHGDSAQREAARHRWMLLRTAQAVSLREAGQLDRALESARLATADRGADGYPLASSAKAWSALGTIYHDLGYAAFA